MIDPPATDLHATLSPARVPAASDAGRRPGETTADLPASPDAGLFFIGVIRTPWPDRAACPKRGDLGGPECRIELDPRWAAGLDGIEEATHLQVLYWMHLARRDLTRQRPHGAGRLIGTFALRSPVRPNPIASSQVRLVRRTEAHLIVRGLDCVDGTPLVDLKPDRCPVPPAR